MLVRSPTMMKFESGRTVSGSRPERRSHFSGVARTRGCKSLTASAMARMWSGVVPQQPPTTLSQPFSANSRRSFAIDRGVSS